ncbi:MAG TPA: ABC transporter permease, partial [Burkholderiaceae bacterium]
MSLALATDTAHAVSDTSDGDRAVLRRQIARLQRVSRWKAIALIAPLLLFLLLVFVVPIGMLLTRAVDNREVSAMLPATARAMQGWTAGSAPSAALGDALVADLRDSPREGVAEVAKRLNYYQSGLRSMVLKTAREVNREP